MFIDLHFNKNTRYWTLNSCVQKYIHYTLVTADFRTCIVWDAPVCRPFFGFIAATNDWWGGGDRRFL